MSAGVAGQVVIVAGGTGALGRAIVRAFLEGGATVVATFRREVEFDALLRWTEGRHVRLHGHRADVSAEGPARALIQETVGQHERLDAVVNAVGGYSGGSPLWEVDSSVLERMLTMNVRSGYALARAAIPVMLKQAGGSFVNVAAKAGVEHPAGAAAYAASKAAALAMMDSLAADVAGTGVRVNSVLPSIIDTEANRQAMPGADYAKWPKAEDIARVIVFLCSSDAAIIHGASIPVYGNP